MRIATRAQAALASERGINLQLEQDMSMAVSEGINYRDNLRKLIEIREQAAARVRALNSTRGTQTRQRSSTFPCPRRANGPQGAATRQGGAERTRRSGADALGRWRAHEGQEAKERVVEERRAQERCRLGRRVKEGRGWMGGSQRAEGGRREGR